MGYNFAIKKIFYSFFFASFFIVAFSALSNKAFAASCTIATNNTSDYEGLVVHVGVYTAGGQYNGSPQISGYAMGINSNANGGTGGDAGIVHVNSSYSIIEGPVSGVLFSPINASCSSPGDSYNAGDFVLTYGASSNNVGAVPTTAGSITNDSGWVLMCGTTTDPGSNQNQGRNFTIKMRGAPTGTISGGQWIYYTADQTIPNTGNYSWNLSDKANGGINGKSMQIYATYVEPQTQDIQGGVYAPNSHDGINGVPIENCNSWGGSTATTYGGVGWFKFNLHTGVGFCIRIQDPFFASNGYKYSGAKIMPWDGVSEDVSASCSGNSSSYEYQVVGYPNSNGTCVYVPPKMNTNGGYDFMYSKQQYALITTTSTASVSSAYSGQQVTFTNTVSSSKTLSDDGTDGYSYTVTDVNNNIPKPDTGNCTASATDTLIPEATNVVTCTVTIPSSISAGAKLCTKISVSGQPDYADVTLAAPVCVNVLAPPTMSITVPTDYEIGSDTVAPTNGGSLVTSLLVGYTVSCNSYVGTLSLAITAPSAFPGQTTSVNCATSGQSLSGTWNVWNSNIDSYPLGKYVFTGSITGGAPSGVPPPTLPITANPGTLQIYTVPYARFYGNDIYSGSSVTFNTKNSLNTGTDGSASQYAIIAKGTISMASAAYRYGKSSPGLNDLSAALTTSPLQSLAGTQGSGSQTVDWGTTGYYGNPATDTVLSAQANVAKKITVVGKDVYINGDITIDQTNLPSSTTPFDDSKTPVVLIVSTGNIYINSSVKRIDALLQAGRDIYTCNNSTNSPSIAVNCTNKLIINGAIGAAQSIHFGRSTGTRLLATANEDMTPKGVLLTSSSGSAAEVINFPSYLYFASPYITTSSSTRYDALNSVAPLL
jgi:hypothetical protein